MQKPSKIRLEYVGPIRHLEKAEHYERVIAGKRISDTKRKAYNGKHEEDGINLEPIEGVFSGDKGFIDFTEVRSDNGLDSIYIGWTGVEPKQRAKGIGAALVREVERIAVERGAKMVTGNFEQLRHDRVFPFLSKLGYSKAFKTANGFFVYKILK